MLGWTLSASLPGQATQPDACDRLWRIWRTSRSWRYRIFLRPQSRWQPRPRGHHLCKPGDRYRLRNHKLAAIFAYVNEVSCKFFVISGAVSAAPENWCYSKNFTDREKLFIDSQQSILPQVPDIIPGNLRCDCSKISACFQIVTSEPFKTTWLR